MSAGLESGANGRRDVVAFKRTEIVTESRHCSGSRLRCCDLTECLSEPGSVLLPVDRATEFAIPKEPERSDFFAAI